MVERSSPLIERLMSDLPDFFFHPEILLVKSLTLKAWQQIEPRFRYQPGAPLTLAASCAKAEEYFTRVIVRERMMMLLPFHHTLFKLLERDPYPLNSKELRRLAKESEKKIKKKPDDFDSWRLFASAYAFLDAMTRSEDVLRKALEHDRSFSDAWYMIGSLLYGFNRFQDAYNAVGQAVQLDPSNRVLEEYYLRISAKYHAERIREESKATDEGGIPSE